MEDEEIAARLRPGAAYSDLPGRHITINQLVAWNMTYFRKAAGLTQEELGEQLGWSKAIVSAAERSWDSKRVRQFTADDIAAVADALGIPIVGLFLPPEDDGVNERYLFHTAAKAWEETPHRGTICHDMRDLMLYVVPDPDEGVAEPAGDEAEEDKEEDWERKAHAAAYTRYWDRYVSAVNGYLRADRIAELADHLEGAATEEGIVEHLARLRSQYEALRDMISDNDHLQTALFEKLIDVREGRPWTSVRRTPLERERDLKLSQLAIELFGRNHKSSREDIDRLLAEARRRGILPPAGNLDSPQEKPGRDGE